MLNVNQTSSFLKETQQRDTLKITSFEITRKTTEYFANKMLLFFFRRYAVLFKNPQFLGPPSLCAGRRSLIFRARPELIPHTR